MGGCPTLTKRFPIKCLILRAVLNQTSPMVIRLISVPDTRHLQQFHRIFRAILGWEGDLGYLVRIHGREFNSFRRNTRGAALCEFQFHRQEKFLYVCDTLHMWEWDVRVLDIQDGMEDDPKPVCLGGRGAAPPENCGSPTGYRLMLKRQCESTAMSDPRLLEAGLEVLAAAYPDQHPATWDLLRSALDEGFQSIDQRLTECGPLQPERFSVSETNQRLSALDPNQRVWA